MVCEESVTIPACDPVSEIALWPRSWIAIAHSAQEIRSPVESSMSISRAAGVSDTSWAMPTRSSVVLPRAESTATTRLPSSRAATIRRAARLMSSGSGNGGAAELHHHCLAGRRHGRLRIRQIRACSGPTPLGAAASVTRRTDAPLQRDISSRYMELSPTAYVILGMLGWRPMSGYEIKSIVDNSTRFFWAASYGQIYPELRRLVAAGLIDGKASPQGGRRRNVYRLTPPAARSCAPGSTPIRRSSSSATRRS